MKRAPTSRVVWPWLSVPGLAWLFIFLAAPLLSILAISFLSRGDYGEVGMPWTVENYQRLAGFGMFGFDWLYPMILVRTVLVSLAVTFVCGLFALPLAFYIAGLRAPWKFIGLIAIVIPFWTNLLVRTYAWQIILSPESWLAKLAVNLHLAPPGQALYPSAAAVLLCMVCDFLPLMALPLYASIEKMDWLLVDAARDLGASRWAVFRHGIWPQISSGLAAGSFFVFLPCLGQFLVPDLLGGARTVLLGNLLQQQFFQSRDWPFGAAVTVAALALVLAGMAALRKALKDFSPETAIRE